MNGTVHPRSRRPTRYARWSAAWSSHVPRLILCTPRTPRPGSPHCGRTIRLLRGDWGAIPIPRANFVPYLSRAASESVRPTTAPNGDQRVAKSAHSAPKQPASPRNSAPRCHQPVPKPPLSRARPGKIHRIHNWEYEFVRKRSTYPRMKERSLEQKGAAEILTQLIDGIDGPCVLAVDAAWGTGKTTFLKMWAQHLRNNRFPVVEFNAWETDHAGDPFVATVTELTEGLRGFEDESLNARIRDTAEAAKQVAVRAIPRVIRLLTAGVLDVDPLIEKEAGRILSSYAEDRLKEYTQTRNSIDGLQEQAREDVERVGHKT